MAEGTLRDEKRRERSKFSSMNKEQKISYIKTYYLGPIVVAIAVLMFIIWFVLETVVFHKEVLLSGCTVNVRISDETKSYLTDGLLEYLGGDSKKQIVNLNSDNYVDYSKDDSAPYGEGMNGYMDQTMLFTQIAAGDFAYMILDESALLNIGESEYFGALDDVLNEDIIEEYELYYDVSGRAVGINLKDTVINVDAYLVFATFTDSELAESLVRYIAKK